MANIKFLATTGFFHIFGASTINKVLSALLSIILVRILSKDEYGLYAYAFNIVSFFVLFNGLGAVSAVLQLCCEAYKNENISSRYYAYGFKAGLVFDTVMAVVIVITGLVMPLSLGNSNELLILLCFYPLITLLCDMKLTRLRAMQKNREYALMTNVLTVCLVVFSLLGALTLQAAGLVLGQYLAYGVAFVILGKKDAPLDLNRRSALSRNEKHDYWGIALTSALNSGLSQALTLVGTFLIGVLLVDQAAVASYKVATTIPFALLFIPGAVITYVYPYFAQRKDDRSWTLTRFWKLVLASCVASGFIVVVCIAFAEPILVLVFGVAYSDAAPAFIVLMIGFFVNSSFRQLAGNMLVTQRRLKFNLVVGVVSIIANVLLSFALIPIWGLVGAAWAYTGTMIVGSALNVPYYCTIAGKAKNT